jgi:hypothetical protein
MRFVAATALIGLAFGVVLRFTGGGAPIGWCMVVALVVWPFIGVLITIDDDLPGGWSNPDGKVRPPWLYWESWADLGTRGAISGIGFAIDAGWDTVPALAWWALGAVGIGASIGVHRRISRIQLRDV